MLERFVFNYEKVEVQFCIDDVQLGESNYVKPICSKLAAGINAI